MLLVLPDAWVATLLICLQKREKSSGNKEKVYSGIFTSQINKAFNQLIGPIRNLEQARETGELKLP